MEEIYVNTQHWKSGPSGRSTRQTGPRRFHGAAVLCLALLSVVLLAGLVGLSVYYHKLAAEISSIKTHLTEERDQLKGNLSEMGTELKLLTQQSLRLSSDLSTVRTQLTQCLQANNEMNETIYNQSDELNRLRLWPQNKTCPSGWSMLSRCYFLSTQSGSWEQGRKDCRDRRADLVVINSPQEQKFLSEFTERQTWIGLTDNKTEGTWLWIDGSPLSLKYWAKNQPDNHHDNEDCAHIGTDNQWNDLHCGSSLRWICEQTD